MIGHGRKQAKHNMTIGIKAGYFRQEKFKIDKNTKQNHETFEKQVKIKPKIEKKIIKFTDRRIFGGPRKRLC